MNDARKASLLIVDDQRDTATALQELLQEAGYVCRMAGSVREAIETIAESFIDLLILDERLGTASGIELLARCRGRDPGLAAIVVTGFANVQLTVCAMRAGALDLLEKPVSPATLTDAVARALTESEIPRQVRWLRWNALRGHGFPEIIGTSRALTRTLDLVRQVGPSNAAVLIQGESGTGKEMIARVIHATSGRRGKAFVQVNAGALPPSLLESTLFGSVKGAYTDSRVDRQGLFEAANGGTLFLDEIGEASPETQVRLLRVLQEKVITRVGDVKAISVDVRVIAATNRDLIAQCKAKAFREDLYFRLAVMMLTLPPLRDRREDVPLLVAHFLEKHGREMHKSVRAFSPAALKRLEEYHWPGNVRELENVVQRAVILTQEDIVDSDAILIDSVRAGEFEGMLDERYRDALSTFDTLYFRRLLERAHGNKTKAAEIAGIDRTVLYSHLRNLSGQRKR